jgi:hypothetical protein
MFQFIMRIKNYLWYFIFPFDTYLADLQDDVEIIDLSHENLTYLLDLSRFYNLKELYI